MPAIPHPLNGPSGLKTNPTFNKIFRWEPADPASPPPAMVAVVGSFTDWQPVPLKKDRSSPAWQLALSQIPGHRTHRYMLLVDGQPAPDPLADGLAVPETAPERAWALNTPRGPRLFMLFSQTK